MENELLTTKDQEIENLKNEIRELKEESKVTFWINRLDTVMLDALTESIKFKTNIQEFKGLLLHTVNGNERISSKHKEQLEDALENFKDSITEIEKSRAYEYSCLYDLYPYLTISRRDEGVEIVSDIENRIKQKES